MLARFPLKPLLVAAEVVVAMALASPGQADSLIGPETKIRIDVFQWSAMTSAYEQWSALGGAFTVSADGSIDTPVVGVLDVANKEPGTIATIYAEQLRAKRGLVSPPEVTVQILEYAPIYVIGDVESPGRFDFRPGLTPLHALALSGGERKDETQGIGALLGRARAKSDLSEAENAIAFGQARLARLEAERTGAKTIAFAPMTSREVSAQYASELVDRERGIFEARARELARQQSSIGELRELLQAEIGVLEQKIEMSDRGIEAAQTELASVSSLVDRGITVASRRTDLERLLDSLQASRLDQTTAIMRARQSIAAATRDFDGVQDRFQTIVAQELQSEQANLEQAIIKRDLALHSLAVPGGEDLSDRDGAPQQPTYAVVRSNGGVVTTSPAASDALLRPGDLVQIEFDPKAIAIEPQAAMRDGLEAASISAAR